MIKYIKNEIKLLPAIIVLFIIFYVVINHVSGNKIAPKKNYSKNN